MTARPARLAAVEPSAERTNGLAGLDAFIESLVEQKVAEAIERLGTPPEPWIGVGEAAEYLACPTSRIYALVSAKRIPHRKDGSRLLFRRAELDEYLDAGGAKRP